MSPTRSRGWRSARREALRDVYKALTPWQKVQVARHPDRPHCLDYVDGLFTDFTPLAGDRAFGEDQAIVGGFAPLPRRAGRRASARRRAPTPRAG